MTSSRSKDPLQGRENELLATIAPRNSGRLSFADRCAAFALMEAGFPQKLVARTFAVTPAAMVHLAACLTSGRYPQVAAERAALGREEFKQKYRTEEHLDRLQQFRLEMKTPELRGPDRYARRYAGWWEFDLVAPGLPNAHIMFSIEWRLNPDCWRYRVIAGTEPHDHRREFRTSTEAFRFACDQEWFIRERGLKVTKVHGTFPVDKQGNPILGDKNNLDIGPKD